MPSLTIRPITVPTTFSCSDKPGGSDVQWITVLQISLPHPHPLRIWAFTESLFATTGFLTHYVFQNVIDEMTTNATPGPSAPLFARVRHYYSLPVCSFSLNKATHLPFSQLIPFHTDDARQQVFIHASGADSAVFNCHKEDGSFELISHQYISHFKPNPTLDIFGSGERLTDLFCQVVGGYSSVLSSFSRAGSGSGDMARQAVNSPATRTKLKVVSRSTRAD